MGCGYAGYAFIMQKGKLVYVHNHAGLAEYRVETSAKILAGSASLQFDRRPAAPLGMKQQSPEELPRTPHRASMRVSDGCGSGRAVTWLVIAPAVLRKSDLTEYARICLTALESYHEAYSHARQMALQEQELSAGEATLRHLTNINVVIGRNGAGKSRFLRALDEGFAGNAAVNVRYISPERAGVFQRQGHISTNMEQNKDWLRSVRRRNQAADFKAASATLLTELETAYNRRILNTPALRDDHSRSFANDLLRRISGLLANISVEQEGSGFVFVTADGAKITAEEISSGESEAIALASEILYFFETLDPLRFNLLLLDEPDVHLHPDLQARLAQFLITSLTALTEDLRDKTAVCLSTHSTPFICALASSGLTSIGTKNFQDMTINLGRASAQLKKVAPFFGHPLSLTLNNEVMLILEGEDDERVWQQAARSSQGRIRMFPVVAASVDQQTEVERFASDVLEALFDNPKAFSIRDGDGQRGALSPVGVVTRFRLQCYEIENTLVTDEALRSMGHTWDTFRTAASRWIVTNPTHKNVELVRRLTESPNRLRDVKIKSIRQLVCSIAGSNKPWEVVVGQVLGTVPFAPAASEASILSFVGSDAARALLTSS